MAAGTEAEGTVGGTTVSRAERPVPRRWYPRPFIVIGIITAIAGGLRFYHLSFPSGYVFDEIYYAKDGCYDAGFPYQRCGLTSPGEQTSTVHPPLGRWVIAGGEVAFGNRSFGWRFSSAVAGTLSVFVVGVLAWRLWGSVLWAGVASLLLATENTNFVQSRISMLDIFLTLFVVMGFLFLVLDRQWMERRMRPVAARPVMHEEAAFELPPERLPSPVLRPWRIAAGLAFGAAMATKWSGAPALLGAIVLSLAWERSRRTAAGDPHPLRETMRDESFGIFVFLVLLPLVVYGASYARYWADNGFGSDAISSWWSNQSGMANYSIHLRATHPYASKAWTWLLLKRPVSYYYHCARTIQGVCARPAEILQVGNPMIFWGSVFVIPYLTYTWIRKRDWRAGLITVAFFFQYLPWFGTARTSFLFYMAPITPFMVLAFTYTARDIADVRLLDGGRSPLAAGVASFLIAFSVMMFVFFLPVLTGKTISYDQWRARMWYGRCLPKATWCWI